VMVSPDQQVAATWIAVPFGGGGSQPPMAKLSSAYGPDPKSRPPTMAGMKPVLGSTAASAISVGSLEPVRVVRTAA
jgi:hypothetical protein